MIFGHLCFSKVTHKQHEVEIVPVQSNNFVSKVIKSFEIPKQEHIYTLQAQEYIDMSKWKADSSGMLKPS
jgi:hypothetical protein